LLTWLTERALEHDKPTLLLQMTGEYLKYQKLLRPGVTRLERLVVTARAHAHHESFHRLQPLLTSEGEKLHALRKFLFFAREGVVSQQYEEGQSNQAGCLNLLTNAVIVWNTMYMQTALHALRAEGYPVREEDLRHLWPTRFAHVHRYGKYTFNIEAARTRTGLRPLTR
jgi:hypothetical protein